MNIRLFITGGTIDCSEIKEDDTYVYTETFLPKMLEQARNNSAIELEELMLKDSLDMDDTDRSKILQYCQDAKEDKIVITHGTDTMTETAKLLGSSNIDKTIVLVGSMIPYSQDNSDALFNLGAAITSVQLLPKGVFISMNGKIFSWDNVVKNREKLQFEEIS